MEKVLGPFPNWYNEHRGSNYTKYISKDMRPIPPQRDDPEFEAFDRHLRRQETLNEIFSSGLTFEFTIS